MVAYTVSRPTSPSCLEPALPTQTTLQRSGQGVSSSRISSTTWPRLRSPDESVVNDPYNLSLRVGILKVTEALPSNSCFTLGIPSGHPAGSHSTTRAISSIWCFSAAIGVEGAFKQAKRPVRLCRAEQVKYARLQHRL